MRLDELFEDWLLFRRDETSAKAGTIRKDVSFWRTHCRKVKIDRTALGDMKVNEVTPKHLYSFFRKLTSGSQHSTQLRSVTLLRGLLYHRGGTSYSFRPMGVVLQIKLCSILQIIRSRFLLCYVNGNRLFGVDSALCFI